MREYSICSAGDGGCTTPGHYGHRWNADRVEGLRRLFEVVASGVVAASLLACGGGGEEASPSPSPTPAPSPSPSPMPISAQLSVPDPVGYDADQLAAFNRLNELRFAAGLGMLAQDRRLDQAAQAHANWLVVNRQFTHVEVPGTTGFTGVNWWDRDHAAGYLVSGGGEVIAFGDQPIVGIDLLMNAIYHRGALLEFDPVDVGIGWVASNDFGIRNPLVVEFSSPLDDPTKSAGQLAQPITDGLVVWPLDGAESVATHMGNEEPDPVRGIDVGELGTPASVSADRSSRIVVGAFTMSESISGATVPTTVLTEDSDPNGLTAQSFVGLIPTVGLKINTRYRVEFHGSIIRTGEKEALPCARSWTFTTGTSAYPSAAK